MRWPASSAGHVPTALGAYYVACPAAMGWDGRLIALAGTAMDVVTAFSVPGLALRAG
ncbi:hypothetical protein [Oleiagrimonas soli]|uniref:Uncharacterized protein n=1 Tax=Oleiagrimonas soli TaxID=1543381 RepID=A0A841KC08_9GAMM|nr:hypothetical protein [Oleiagrimonas soli]MBB6182686.1 hypothetical protein [Oleiagrimonas soli]